MTSTARSLAAALLGSRGGLALQRTENWVQLLKFCVVGASGYAVNLSVYAVLVKVADVHYLPAAVCSFLVAVTNNYVWNRRWTFRGRRGHFAYQGLRFLVVSTAALGLNLAFLRVLVALGLGSIAAQAVAIVLVMPVNFVANKLWSFSAKRASPVSPT